MTLALAACLALASTAGAAAAARRTITQPTPPEELVGIGVGRPGDRYNPLFEVDKQPNGGTNVVDCNDYGNLSTAGNTVNGNFALPSNNWLTLANWQAHNGHGWDADSAVGGFSANCPSGSIP